MNKYLLFSALFLALSCGEEKSSTSSQEPVLLDEPTVETQSAAPAEHEGYALIEGANCRTCHKVDAAMIGPSYKDVAAKYTAADSEYLATKIIEGGQGVWGQVPMTPHPGLSRENAKKMVEYILTLKENQ